MRFKRFLALLLALMLFASLLPAVHADSKTDKDSDIWEQIASLEDTTLAKRGIAKTAVTAADFAAISEDVEQLVVTSDSYVKGTLERHGSFFFWETADGQVCGYSPQLRAKMHAETVNADADPEDYSAVETCSSSRLGGAGAKNVAVFQPYYGIDTSFKSTYSTEGVRIAKALGGSSTTYKTTKATIDQIAQSIESCGVVLFDSHGTTDYDAGNNLDYVSRANSSYIVLQTNAGITSEDQQRVLGKYGYYYHAFYAGSYKNMQYNCFDGTAIANHMSGTAKCSMLWMAICLGMATDGLEKPLRERGVEVVYGYSQSVSFTGDYAYEKPFWDYMISDHTAGEAFAYMKKKTGCNWDPAYSNYTQSMALRQYVAFPVLVSSEDPYPGHGNVDKVFTPVSTWTLIPRYTVSAVANNTAWGDVSVSGTTITAIPKSGYFAKGYAVTEGSATVTQRGKIFTVSPASDCTVRIDFAPSCAHDYQNGVCTICGVKMADQNPFVDVPNDDWYARAVLWATSQEPAITSGTDATHFAPTKTCTRAEIVQFLWNAAGKPEPGGASNPFKDVSASDWYYKAVLWAVENGVTSGTDASHFSPTKKCTRAEVVMFLCNAAGTETDARDGDVPEAGEDELPVEPEETLAFTDVKTDDWYYSAVVWAVKNGITSGTDETHFSPTKVCTRAEVVQFLYKAS